jgi:hypothetical protein
MMIRIDRTKIGDIWHDQAIQMAIGYILIAVMFAFIATSKPQFRYVFLMVPAALACAGVMAWVFIHNTNSIISNDDDHDERVSARQPDHAHQQHERILTGRDQNVTARHGLTHSDSDPMKTVPPLPTLLRHPLARRHARQLEYRNQVDDQALAWRVQDIIAGLGLSQADSSVGGGRTFHVPQVVSVAVGPPMGLTIRTLPGQMPDDFAAHAPAIAYNLGVAEVQVIPLGPSLIRLDLLTGSD